MSRARSQSNVPVRRTPSSERPIRLDLLTNPYGPSVHVHDALAGTDELHLPNDGRQARLQLRIAHLSGLPADWLLLGNGADELLRIIALARRDRGPLVLFPPTDPADARRARQHGLDVVELQRSPSFALDLDRETLSELPRGGTALVGSPNDPTGTPLSAQDAVRLSRACELVIVDERHAEYGARTLLPLARELDNMIVLRSFETWAGLAGLPFAYLVAPPSVLAPIAPFGRPDGIAAGAMLGAWATLDDLPYVRATVQRVREERARLVRTLRKLNMVRPCPSSANFVLTRIERGQRDQIVRDLGQSGIWVHQPRQPELARFIRISATRPDHTDELKRALIEIAATL